jgi:hypothetical protein
MGAILRTVIAFSNGSGGQIIIGVDDDKTIVGVDQDPLELEERLSSSIYDSISPIPSVFFQTIAIQDKILFKNQSAVRTEQTLLSSDKRAGKGELCTGGFHKPGCGPVGADRVASAGDEQEPRRRDRNALWLRYFFHAGSGQVFELARAQNRTGCEPP